ncbi:hypothetical protein BGX24_003393 [Mortierella sp. AD032]|nr:hypothetical protein BGX24_003393 [Mortierella sp. AD032]
MFEDILVDALVKHARTLEVIRLGNSIVCGGENIDRLLRSCPNLKELGIMGHFKAVHGGGLDARAIKDSEWVCKNLEVFECPIRNIPRLDIAREVDILKHTRAPIKEGTLQESIDLQHQIYAKLAQFTKLRELTLSLPLPRQGTLMYHNSLRRGFRQYDCLAMTLKSGLGLLKDLKDLKVVRLEGMEVYVDGDEEQSWVKEQWPKARISWTYNDDDCYDSSSSESESEEDEDSEEDRLDESSSDDDIPISNRCRRM